MAPWIDHLTMEEKAKMYEVQDQEEHLLNKQAVEMLQYYLNEVDPVIGTEPILELMDRMIDMETSPLLEKWIKLSELPQGEMIQRLEATEMVPELTQQGLENLSQDPLIRFKMKPPIPKWVTQVEWTHQDMKRDLIYLLEAVEVPEAEV